MADNRLRQIQGEDLEENNTRRYGTGQSDLLVAVVDNVYPQLLVVARARCR
jgi:hypothetical protein